MAIQLTPEDVQAQIAAIKGQLSPLSGQIQSALTELAGMEQLLEQVQSVRRPDLFLKAIGENLRAMVDQLNTAMHLTLPRVEEEPEPAPEDRQGKSAPAHDEDHEEDDELTSAPADDQDGAERGKVVSVQPQGARFITMMGEIHHIAKIPQTYAEAAAHIYEQSGGLNAPIRIPIGGRRNFAYVPLRFVIARGGGFMFWNNIQAARRTLGELYKAYGKNQIRKSDLVSPAARRMHNRTRSRGLERVDEILAKWEASLEADAARARIEVMSELIVKFLTEVFDEADVPETRDEALAHAYDEWKTIHLIIPQYGEEGESPKTFLRSLEEDINSQTSHFVDSLGWVISQLETIRRNGTPNVSKFIEEKLRAAAAVMQIDDADRWTQAINVLWRRYQVLEAEVAGKVTKFDKD